MLVIDVSSAYVISGAGALVGAGLLLLAESQESMSVAALRIFRLGLTVLGVGLVSFVAQGAIALPTLQVVISASTLVSMVFCAWGLGLLSGQEVSARAMILIMAIMALLPLVGYGYGTNGLAIALAGGMVVTSFLNTFLSRSFLFAPPNAPARVVGLAMLAMSLTSILRLFWTLSYDGSPQPHLMHVPLYMQSVLAVFYGFLPSLLAAMVLLIVNARLQTLLTLRARTDELTGASSRRALHELAPSQIQRSERRQQQTAVLMLDLDHFKKINDTFGHATGDVVLKATVQLWRNSLRSDSILARYGGEEFVALVPVDQLETAQQVAQRMCNAIANAPWETLAACSVGVTTSVGVTMLGQDEPLDAAVKRADAALYDAKKAGRNRIAVRTEISGI